MPPVLALLLPLVLGAPLEPSAPPVSKIASPSATTGGAAAETPDDTRTSPPSSVRTTVRDLLPLLGESLDVTPTEQVLLDGVAASLRAGDDEGAHATWTKLLKSKRARSSTVDIEAMVMWVLHASYLEQTEDLRAMADKVKYFNEAKKSIRDHLQQVKAEIAKAPSKAARITLPTVTVAKKRRTGKKIVGPGKPKARTIAEWQVYTSDLEQKLQTLGEDAQLANLELQAALDTKSEVAAKVSAVIKKYNDTAKAIVSNIRG